jgi:hypothetical protein
MAMLKAFGRLDAAKQDALAADLLALGARYNHVGAGVFAAPAEYLEVILTT